MSSTVDPGSGALILVRDTDAVEAALRVGCPPATRLEVFSSSQVIDDRVSLTAHGRSLIEWSASCDAVLIEWHLEHAAIIHYLSTQLRAHGSTPTVALVNGGQEDGTGALASGADALHFFPFFYPLLQAQIAAYRRVAALRPPDDRETELPTSRPVVCGSLRLDPSSHRFYAGDREVELTRREFDLVGYLMMSPDRLCTRDELLDHVWGLRFETGTNMVDVYVHFIRRKLEAAGVTGVIQTIRGLGYRLTVPA